MQSTHNSDFSLAMQVAVISSTQLVIAHTLSRSKAPCPNVNMTSFHLVYLLFKMQHLASFQKL
jgi:hypothetical protein